MTRLMLAALVTLTATLVTFAAPPSARAAPIVGVSQQCQPDGKVAVTFSWYGNDPTAIQQWIDLSIFNNGWQPGSFVGAGPFPGTTTSFTWNGLVAGVRHYTRVNQQLRSGVWDPSLTYMFDTPACEPGKPTGKLSSMLQRLADMAAAGTLAPTPEGMRAQLGQGSGAGSIRINPDGRVVTEILLYSVSPALIADLSAREVQVIGIANQTVTAGVFPRRLDDVAAMAEVVRITEVLTPSTGGGGGATTGPVTP